MTRDTGSHGERPRGWRQGPREPVLFPGLLPWPGAWGHLEGHPGCLPSPTPHASLCLLKPLYLKVRESAFVPLAWTKDNLWANTKPPCAGASRPLRARDGAPHSSSRTGDSHAPETPAVGPKGVPNNTHPREEGTGPWQATWQQAALLGARQTSCSSPVRGWAGPAARRCRRLPGARQSLLSESAPPHRPV